ncbi:TlpA disulfide reductase family protein [Pedobacter sp.]|jgi:cytochrome oxidase Cu insertion factor (SCO1/SenC/PrrC family)|uniref:TlpA family protein disulfide reductase n=1 Tax=Pedobacter sp. TaxID=1411316 RepID=UPI002BB4D57F|nr:TlpA disulfide reductase family protein [Pedobacter sp.]HWW38055.1 TlpA disulfide reductase family protein [Pedobacter sp.]
MKLYKTILLTLATIASVSTLKAQFKTAPIIITGIMGNGPKTDSVTLDIMAEFGNAGHLQAETSLDQSTQAGNFHFVLKKSSKPFYVSFHSTFNEQTIPFSWENHNLDNYLVEPGDSIYIAYDNQKQTVSFSGKGAEKFTWRYNLRQFAKQFNIIPPSVAWEYDTIFPNLEAITNYAISSLEALKNKVTPEIYPILKADALYFLSATYSNMASLRFAADFGDTAITERTLNNYKQKLLNYPIDTAQSDLKSYSSVFGNLMVEKARADFAYHKIKGYPNPSDVYTLLKTCYSPGKLRDKAILGYMYTMNAAGRLTDSLLKAALLDVKTILYREKLIEIQDNNQKGKTIKDFDFRDLKGKKVQLADFKGKIIVLDMWFTGCAGCIQVAKNLPAVEEALSGHPDIIFLSLSVDKDKNKWLKSIDPNKKAYFGYTHYTTPTTIYMNTGEQSFDHPFINRYNPTKTFPRVMIIDKQGKIFSSSPPSLTEEGNKDAFIKLLETAL